LPVEPSVVELSIAEAAIAQWRQWQVQLSGKPSIVRTLGVGLSNQSYLLHAGEACLVLRINNRDGQLPGFNPQREPPICREASEAAMPPPLWLPQDRYLVSAFVEGYKSTPADQVFGLLEKCHAIKIDTDQIDYAQHIQTYWAKIEQSGKPIHQALINKRQAMQKCLLRLSAQQQTTVLCHHDPIMANFVGSPERLYLIDWEYAALGMAVMDYAALAVEWGFSDATICARTDIHPRSLAMAKKLYRYMCQLWQATQR